MSKKSGLIEVVPVPGFFGHVVKPGQSLMWKNEDEFCMQLNSAALGFNATKGRSTLSVVAKTSLAFKIALCTLAPEVAEQWNLTQTFTPLDGEIKFIVDGPNAIHVTGYIEEKEEDSGDDHDVFDDIDDIDDKEDDMMVFGEDLSTRQDTDEEEEEDLNDQDKSYRFEVLDERIHNNELESKKELHKEGVAATMAAINATNYEKKAKEATKKVNTNKLAEKEKRVAEKLAEASATNPKNKKRAAPVVESIEVPKKAKVATRVYKGVTIEDVAVGKGRPVVRGRKVGIVYRGRLTNGKQFDATQNRKKPFTFRHGIGDVIKGMDIGIEGMRVGSIRTITIPSRLGYGREGSPPIIPGNSDLIFEIEVVTA